MDGVTAASSTCQPSLHALHTEATAAATRQHSRARNDFNKTKIKVELFALQCEDIRHAQMLDLVHSDFSAPLQKPQQILQIKDLPA
ncbi:hypothetical protein NQZ68_017955 [Dissostichus eleginoides]|nr:hypothetical protein NQZ68_017955 [Dissostichus eleginoides]